MRTEAKIYSASFKALDSSDGSMTYEAIVSVFGNRDYAGDVVQPGAFSKSLANWAASGRPMPVYYAHRLDDPNMCIGSVLDAAEVLPGDARLADATGAAKENGGLWTKIQLDADNPTALQVWKLIKSKRLNQSSFTYEVKDGSFVMPMGTADQTDPADYAPPYYSLDELDVFEVGPCPLGCNDQTQVLATKDRQSEAKAEAIKDKSDEAMAFALAVLEAAGIPNPLETQTGSKVGRALSSKNEASLKTAYDEIGAVLSSLGSGSDDGADEGKTVPTARRSAKLAVLAGMAEFDLMTMEG